MKNKTYVYKPMHSNGFMIATLLVMCPIIVLILIIDNYELTYQMIILFVTLIAATLYSLMQFIKQIIIGYKVEFFEDIIIVHKSRCHQIEIKSSDIVNIISDNGSIIVIYNDNELNKTINISPVKSKTALKSIYNLYENVMKSSPNDLEMINALDKETYETKDFFKIRNPKWQLVLFLSLFSLSSIGLLIAIVFFILGKLEGDTLLAMGIIGSFFILISLFGIYVWFREILKYENGTLLYRKVFTRSQSARINEIKYIYIGRSSYFLSIDMMDYYGRTLINFMDDGTAFKSGDLLGILQKNDVKEINEIEYLRLKEIQKNK